MPKLKRKTVLLYLLILVVLYLIIRVVPSLTGALASTQTIRAGRLTISDDVDCWIVRDETVYTAPKDGRTKSLVEDGTLVKKGTKILELRAASSNQTKHHRDSQWKELMQRLGSGTVTDSQGLSGRKGIVSYYVDGYENWFTPERMKQIHLQSAQQRTEAAEHILQRDVQQGDPLYKIADQANWYLLCWIDQGDIGKYETGNTVTVKLPAGTVNASIFDISKEKKYWRLILRSNDYYPDFGRFRAGEGKVITSDATGLLVDNPCVTTKNGKTGVYVRSTTGEYVFTPVQVLGTDGKKTLLAEGAYYDKKGNPVNTVEMYDEVLRHPDSDKEG